MPTPSQQLPSGLASEIETHAHTYEIQILYRTRKPAVSRVREYFWIHCAAIRYDKTGSLEQWMGFGKASNLFSCCLMWDMVRDMNVCVKSLERHARVYALIHLKPTF